MSKGLRALKRITDFLKVNTPHWKQDVSYIEKELKDYEWLKSKINIDFFYQLSSDDRLKLVEIMGVKYENRSL